jgi:protocatechuate 3,4-dioxygenase, alpha subunit
MKEDPPFIPSSSQTVGPFFSIGLDYMADRAPKLDSGAPGIVQVSGRVLDANGNSVPDAILEFWHPQSAALGDRFPGGFHRVATSDDGLFSVLLRKPDSVVFPGGRQAPHNLVLVFCRGLLRHLVTRVYFGLEPANDADPVLLRIDPERRATLIARRVAGRSDAFEWDVVLQGAQETVFFAW